MYRNNDPTTQDQGTYCTYLFQREAVRFLKEHHQQPFFLYVPFNAPHGASNLDPKIRSAAQAPAKYKALYPELAQEAGYASRTRYGEEAQVANAALRRLEYAASVTCMDDAIGELLRLLDELALSDNTIVIFFSDNGGGGGSDNSPLRGGKGRMFEGGIRVPCIVRYPKRIPAGSTSDAFLTSLEIVPTLLAEIGFKPPASWILDGFDIMPVLAKGQPSPRTSMFWQRRDDKAARVGDWKWVESAAGNGLFDLKNDIAEQHDLSETHPEKLAELQARFAQWQAAMEAAEPRGPFRDY